METCACRPSHVPQHDLWPLARLACVLALIAFWLHHRFSHAPDASLYVKWGLAILGALFCLMAMASVNLARVYASVLIFPFYALTVLNDWFYDGCYWLYRTILRLFYMRRVSAFIAFLCELGIFAGLWYTAELLIRRY